MPNMTRAEYHRCLELIGAIKAVIAAAELAHGTDPQSMPRRTRIQLASDREHLQSLETDIATYKQEGGLA